MKSALWMFVYLLLSVVTGYLAFSLHSRFSGFLVDAAFLISVGVFLFCTIRVVAHWLVRVGYGPLRELSIDQFEQTSSQEEVQQTDREAAE